MKQNNFLQAILIVPVIFAALCIQFACSKKIDVQKIPTVTTGVITGITENTAISGGNVTSDGGASIMSRGVCWDTIQDPGTSSYHTSDSTGTGEFVSDLYNLSPNTSYYLRAYAINSAGIAYGAALTFSTLSHQFTCGDPITYNGKLYHTVLINEQCWFRENLNVGTRINGSTNQTDNGILEKHCYNDEEINCDFYGGLYQWNEMMQYSSTHAQGICPVGWHIPTDIDWVALSESLGGDSLSGGKMKMTGSDFWALPNIGATNSSGFSAVAAGNHSLEGFGYLMQYAFLWSSTLDNSRSSYAWSRSLYYTSRETYRGVGYTENSFSVRCKKDILPKDK